MDIRERIATELGISRELLREALEDAHKLLKKIKIKKRSGGHRVIFQPSGKLKTIQYWLIHNIFQKLDIDDAAIAYRRNISILDNAERHRQGKYFLKVDLKDFFPSIRFDDFLPLLKNWHKSNVDDWIFDGEAEDLIKKSCFLKDGSLPIGYPSSPIISNAVMYQFDVAVKKLIADASRFGAVTYTRYADDLVFSTDKPKICGELLVELRKIIKTNVPKIQVNEAKIRTGSSSGGSAFLTGLRVCYDGHITIHRKQKDHVRLLLSLAEKGQLKESDYRSLNGHLAYIKHVDPSFYSKLQQRYFKVIAVVKKGCFVGTKQSLPAEKKQDRKAVPV